EYRPFTGGRGPPPGGSRAREVVLLVVLRLDLDLRGVKGGDESDTDRCGEQAERHRRLWVFTGSTMAWVDTRAYADPAQPFAALACRPPVAAIRSSCSSRYPLCADSERSWVS